MSVIGLKYRPVLVGMCNPHSDDPRMALYPDPPNSAGDRLYKLLLSRLPRTTVGEYARAFDRRNLLPRSFADKWDRHLARARAEEMLPALDARRVIIFGSLVRNAFRLDALPVGVFMDVGGARIAQLPHPSGRCLWYNHEANRSFAADLLAEMFKAAPTRKR